MREYIAAGQYGRLFLQQLRRDVERMADEPDPIGEDIDFFAASCALMDWAVEAREAAMMYLSAEGQRRGFSTEPFARDYIDAAKRGSAHAQLWLAYCADQGICEVPEPELTEITGMLAANEPPDTLILEELGFLAEAFDWLCWRASSADISEDAAVAGDPPGPPNPGWRTLVHRLIKLSDYIHDLGQPYCYEEYEFSTYRIDFERGLWIRDEKRAWEKWCRERNYLA